MRMTVYKTIGEEKIPFTVEGGDLFEMVMASKKLSFTGVKTCGLCKKSHLYLDAYETKEDKFKYVKVVCADCGATLTFGQPKSAPGTFYLRRKENSREYDWQPKPAEKPKA